MCLVELTYLAFIVILVSQTLINVTTYPLLFLLHLFVAWTLHILFNCLYEVSENVILSWSVDVAFCAVCPPARPDPPTDLELTDQKKRSVQLTWTPGDEHSSPIQSMSWVCVCVYVVGGFYATVSVMHFTEAVWAAMSSEPDCKFYSCYIFGI